MYGKIRDSRQGDPCNKRFRKKVNIDEEAL
jgi:hypothetical protein